MKTILIPLNGIAPIQMSKKLREAGVIDLEFNSNKIPIQFIYKTGISGQAKYESQTKHSWLYEMDGNKLTGTTTHHRIKLSEAGEQMLKDNGINYDYE